MNDQPHMKIALFIPAENPASVSILEPIAKQLRLRGYRSVFLSMERLYPYGTEQAYEKLGLEYTRITVGKPIVKRNRIRYLIVYWQVRSWAKRFIRRIKPAVTVTLKNTGIPGLFVMAAKEQRYPTLLVQEGIFCELQNPSLKLLLSLHHISFWLRHLIKVVASILPPPFDVMKLFVLRPSVVRCDITAAAGEHGFDIFARLGVPRRRIVITGSPAYDGFTRAAHAPSWPDALPFGQEKFAGKKLVLFAQQPLREGDTSTAAEEDRVYRNVVDKCTRFDGVELIIKVHPRDSVEYINSRIAAMGLGDRKYHIYKGGSVDQILPFCSAFITISSTTLLNALLYEVPVILAGYVDAWYELSFDESTVVMVDRPQDMRNALETVLFDEKMRNRLIQKGKLFLERFIYKQDGKSALRIAQIAQKLAERKIDFPLSEGGFDRS